ncbi:MAG: hypothetical protein LQ349_005645 [Xanthoria aureola]|nr:MAG: hypothetical protein LQ349_005645 [Xanthoria aureola]
MVLKALNIKETSEVNQAKRRLHLPINGQPVQCSFAQRDIPGKGRGTIALHAITAGTLILAERPLVSVNNVEDRNISQATIARINNAVQQLTPAELQEYQALFKPFPRRTAHPDKERFLANNFHMESSQGSKQTQGVFLRAARFNHSCIPNAWCNWNPDYRTPGQIRGSLTVYAIRNIDQGDEIVVNYHSDNAYKEASERQRLLLEHYDFRCNCPACQPGGEHAARRMEMDVTAGTIEDSRGNDPAAIWTRKRKLVELLELLKEEGLEYPQKAELNGELAQMYVDDVRLHCQMRIPHFDALFKAQEFFRAKLDAEIVSLGVESAEVRETLQLLYHLK